MPRLALCLSFVLACGLRADEKRPYSPQLLQGAATLEGENLHCRITAVAAVQVSKRVPIQKDGKAEVKAVTETVYHMATTHAIVPLKKVRGFVAVGNEQDPTKALRPIGPARLAQVMKANPHLLFASGGEPSSARVRELKEQSIILVLPGQDTPPPKELRR